MPNLKKFRSFYFVRPKCRMMVAGQILITVGMCGTFIPCCWPSICTRRINNVLTSSKRKHVLGRQGSERLFYSQPCTGRTCFNQTVLSFIDDLSKSFTSMLRIENKNSMTAKNVLPGKIEEKMRFVAIRAHESRILRTKDRHSFAPFLWKQLITRLAYGSTS